MMLMVWATVPEVQAYWAVQQAADGDAQWPPLPGAPVAVQALIDRAARELAAVAIRWPETDESTGAPVDAEVRGHLVVAVAETIRARKRAQAQAEELGGDAAAALIAAGGTVSAGSLTVSGGGRRAQVGAAAPRVPVDAVWALQAAGMVGGSVATW